MNLRHESLNPDRDPRTAHLRLGASALPSYMWGPAEIILSGSTKCPLPPDVSQKSFENLFFQTMNQGVSLNDDLEPQFFFPKTYLKTVGRTISERHPKPADYASGLSDIVATKNSPKHRSDPNLQSQAEKAMREYLDPQLFDYGHFRLPSTHEIDVIRSELSAEAQADPMLKRLLDESFAQREEISQRNRDFLLQYATDKDLEQRQRDREEQDRQEAIRLLQYLPTTPIAKVRDILQESPNRIAFERVNALEVWRKHIGQANPDANLTECIRSFQPEPPVPDRPQNYFASDLYAVIAFDYKGHRCMIAECCNDQKQPSAAMKIWRGELNDPNGWEQMFTKTKKEASKQGLSQNLYHANLAAAVSSRENNDHQHVVEAEDKLFHKALHYFATGELQK